MAVAAASMAATTSVQSSNVVGYDNSYTAGSANNFCSAPFFAIGYNTVDIQSIQIPGAEWDGVSFSIWEGVPTVREGSELSYWDAELDPNWDGESSYAYWGDEEGNRVEYSIEAGQAAVLDGLTGYTLQTAGQVPSSDVSITAGSGNNFLCNPFPQEIDINAIQIPGAEWDGVSFSIWEGIPTVREGSEFSYWDAELDPNWDGESSYAYWGDEEGNRVEYSIAPGEGFVLDGCSGYEVTIAKPYSL